MKTVRVLPVVYPFSTGALYSLSSRDVPCFPRKENAGEKKTKKKLSTNNNNNDKSAGPKCSDLGLNGSRIVVLKLFACLFLLFDQ